MTKHGRYTVCYELAVLQAEIYTNVHAKYKKMIVLDRVKYSDTQV